MIKDKDLLNLSRQQKLLQQVVNQIEKDINLTGISFEIREKPFHIEDFFRALCNLFADLISNDIEKLAALFYRVDIDENEWKSALSSFDQNDLENTLNVLLIKRTLQKVVNRSLFDSK